MLTIFQSPKGGTGTTVTAASYALATAEHNGKAMLIDFNYETEPLPGRYPLPGVGPFTLLEESNVNHWGKLGFKWLYWNALLPGKELPLDHRMLMAGKQP